MEETKNKLKRGFEPYIKELEDHKRVCTDYDGKIKELMEQKRIFIADDERTNGMTKPICDVYTIICDILDSEHPFILWPTEDMDVALFLDVIDAIQSEKKSDKRHQLTDTVISTMGSELCDLIATSIFKTPCTLTALYRSDDVDADDDLSKGTVMMDFTDVVSVVDENGTSMEFGRDCVIPHVSDLDKYASAEMEARLTKSDAFRAKVFMKRKYLSMQIKVKCFSVKRVIWKQK